MKFCHNCGKELEDDAVFCSGCGAKQAGSPEDLKEGPQAYPAEAEGSIVDITEAQGAESAKKKGSRKAKTVDGSDPYVSKNVVLCTDGKYRWVYEMNLFKDLTVFWIVLKIFGGIILAMGIIDFFIQLFGDHDYKSVLFLVGIMLGIFIVLSILGYVVYAAMNGGKYCVVFTMDDEGILHEQQAKQAKKAELVADLLVLAGALAGNLTTIGMGLSSARRTSMYTSFAGTKKLIANAKKGRININATLDRNIVYCDDSDFNFVWNYIKSRCTGAQIEEKF